jgi:hypothetical protein
MFYRIVILYWITMSAALRAHHGVASRLSIRVFKYTQIYPAELRARVLTDSAVDYSATENYRIIY